MKQVITIAMIVFGMNATAQIQVENVNEEKQKIFYSLTRQQTINRYVTDSDTVFYLFYQNAKYQHITSIESIVFSNTAELKQWLDLVEKVVDNKETFVITLESGEQMKMKKQLRSCTVLTTKGWFYFDYKSIDRVRNSITD